MEISKRALVAGVAAVVLAAGTVGGGVAWAVTQTFSDVPTSNPFHSQIEWAAANGIVNGYPDGTFKPTANVTRQTAAAFLGRLNDEIELVYGGSGPVPNPGSARSAMCPEGKRALAGGSVTTSTSLYLQDSYPVTGSGTAATDPSMAKGWRVYYRVAPNVVLPGGVTAQVWVLCAPAFSAV